MIPSLTTYCVNYGSCSLGYAAENMNYSGKQLECFWLDKYRWFLCLSVFFHFVPNEHNSNLDLPDLLLVWLIWFCNYDSLLLFLICCCIEHLIFVCLVCVINIDSCMDRNKLCHFVSVRYVNVCNERLGSGKWEHFLLNLRKFYSGTYPIRYAFHSIFDV